MKALKAALVVWLVWAGVGCWGQPAGEEEVVGFHPQNAEVKNLDGRWKVVDGDRWLLDFDQREDQARQALKIIKHYGLNQQCYIGSPTRVMGFFLVDGKAPGGPCEGEDAIAFNPGRLEAKCIQEHWKVVDGDLWLLDFEGRDDYAKLAIRVIRKYGFDHICYVGRPGTWPGIMMYFRRSEGEAPAPQAAPTGKSWLKVTVIEGEKGLAVRPCITLRHAERPSENPESLVENPASFELAPGSYQVSAHVGTGPETPPKPVLVEDGRTAEVTIDTGTGTLEITLNAGGKPIAQVQVVDLRNGTQVVAGESQSPARFQAQAGVYLVRVHLSGGQFFDVPDVPIVAGETTRKTVEVPCGRVVVTVSGGGYAVGGGKYPMVEIQKDGRFVTALADNPARFQFLSGEYTVGIREGENFLASRKITLEPGQDLTVEITR